MEPVSFTFGGYRFQASRTLVEKYKQNLTGLKTIIETQGNVLSKDDINVLVEEEEHVVPEVLDQPLDLVVEEPSCSTSKDQNEEPTIASKTVDEEDKYIWDDTATRRLIDYRKEHSNKFDEGRITKKAIWEIICIKFNATRPESETKLATWLQLKSKWQKLETKFKEVQCHNNKSENNKKTFKFMEEMEDAIGDNPNVRPVSTISSMNLKEDSGKDSVSSCSSKGKGKKRKVDLVTTLTELKKEREDRYERFESLMKEMNKERCDLMRDFISVLKDKK